MTSLEQIITDYDAVKDKLASDPEMAATAHAELIGITDDMTTDEHPNAVAGLTAFLSSLAEDKRREVVGVCLRNMDYEKHKQGKSVFAAVAIAFREDANHIIASIDPCFQRHV
jgi:hypothetical protein